MNTYLLKQKVIEDCQRRLDNVVSDELMKGEEKTGLYKRILKTNRSLLYQAMGKVLDVSQSGHNRDELSFFESLNHLFHYYLYDDGVLTIEWVKFNFESNEFDNSVEDKGRPQLCIGNDDSPNRATEEDIHKLLDWHEDKNEKYKKDLIELFGEDDESVKCLEEINYIDYE